MNIQIIFDSKYGNGRKIVEYLTAQLIAEGHETTMNYVKDIKPSDILGADLYIFHSPTHISNPTRKIMKFIKKISCPENAKYACIATYLAENTQAIPKMESNLSNRGLKKAADGLLIKVKGMKGPLEEDYQTIIDDFIRSILQ